MLAMAIFTAELTGARSVHCEVHRSLARYHQPQLVPGEPGPGGVAFLQARLRGAGSPVNAPLSERKLRHAQV